MGYTRLQSVAPQQGTTVTLQSVQVRYLGSMEGAELAIPESQRQHAHRVYHCTEIVHSYRCAPGDQQHTNGQENACKAT